MNTILTLWECTPTTVARYATQLALALHIDKVFDFVTTPRDPGAVIIMPDHDVLVLRPEPFPSRFGPEVGHIWVDATKVGTADQDWFRFFDPGAAFIGWVSMPGTRRVFSVLRIAGEDEVQVRRRDGPAPAVTHPYTSLETSDREATDRIDNPVPVKIPTVCHGEPANERQEGGTHYKTMGVQPWAVVDTWPREQRIGAYRLGALKYIMRMGTKDESLGEIRKARHYLDKLIETLEQQ